MLPKCGSEVRGKKGGFTLIELLIVIVVIGILAAIVVARYTTMKERAFVASVQADLRNLSSAQELYYANQSQYTTDINALNFSSSDGVTVSVNQATLQGWAATATHDGLTARQCGIYYGTASAAQAVPATTAGAVACN